MSRKVLANRCATVALMLRTEPVFAVSAIRFRSTFAGDFA